MRIELLNPKNDYVFKRIFGQEENEEITKQLISTILKKPIKQISVNENPILEKDLMDDKLGIIDIHAKIDETIDVDIEMQIREEKHATVILTDVLEIYIIELPKAMIKHNIEEKNIKPWLDFLENPKDMEMIGVDEKNAVALKEAKKVLTQISEDEHERYLAMLREKYILDKKATEEFGYDKGVKDGIQQEKIQIAKEMLRKNTNIEFIMSVTKLTKEEIEKLK